VTVHHAIARRSGKWWAIEVTDVPGAFTQTRRIDQIEQMTRDVLAAFLDVPPDSFDLEVTVQVPDDWRAKADAVRRARAEAKRAEAEAGERAREAARWLHEQGLPVRDVGAVLNVSAQRVSQLLKDAS
jgi:hypothetical protein